MMTEPYHVKRTMLMDIVMERDDIFPDEFVTYLSENFNVYDAFEREAFKVINRGYSHYSARTIIEVLRHHSNLSDNSEIWKLADHPMPYLSRLFAIHHPPHANLFSYRLTNLEKRLKEQKVNEEELSITPRTPPRPAVAE
jgi:hypothetical protein